MYDLMDIITLFINILMAKAYKYRASTHAWFPQRPTIPVHVY
jgi:hypothetical protein